MSLFAYLTMIGMGPDGTQHNKHYYIGCFLRPTDQKWVIGKGWGAIGVKPREKIITESVKHGAFASEDQARAYVKATVKAETEKNGYKLEWLSTATSPSTPFSQVVLSDPSGQRDKPAWFAPEAQTPRTPVLKAPTLAPAFPAPAVAGPAPKAPIPAPVSKSGAALIKAKADVIAANPPVALPEELPPEPEENKDGIFGRKPSLTVVWRD